MSYHSNSLIKLSRSYNAACQRCVRQTAPGRSASLVAYFGSVGPSPWLKSGEAGFRPPDNKRKLFGSLLSFLIANLLALCLLKRVKLGLGPAAYCPQTQYKHIPVTEDSRHSKSMQHLQCAVSWQPTLACP